MSAAAEEATDYHEDSRARHLHVQVGAGDDSDHSRPSSRASLSGRGSPIPDFDMDNIVWDELPLEKLYEYFAQAPNLLGVVRAFDALKTKLGLDGVHGIELFRSLKEKLSSQKTWKARDVLQMLDKRANQQEYKNQTAAKGVKVLIGRWMVLCEERRWCEVAIYIHVYTCCMRREGESE